MASTYSTSLKLELMATGDQSGTWGDTTNTNLGTLLEQAITGVLSVAQGDVANLTLTDLNGASDEARNAVINVTGAMTANRNVVVPTANKVYLFKNSTTGGFVITVKTVAGTGVTIPNGTARWVYCDGTNVVDALSGPWTPSANDGQALGASGTAWADLFLASGAVINWNAGDVTLTHAANTLTWAGATSGYLFADGQVGPATNDGVALGVSGTAWADLFLASGGVINWNAGNYTLTHSAGLLTTNGALTVGGAATASTFVPNSSSAPTDGMYLPAASTLGWSVGSAAEMQLTSTALSPAADGGSSLGTTALGWQNLFGNTGFVLNIEGGNWVATHTSGIMTVGTGDLRVTTAGTNAASVATVGGTQTLTAKTLTSPTITTSPTAAGATWTDLGSVTTVDINGGTADGVVIGGASAAAGTFTTLTATGAFTSLGIDDNATGERFQLADTLVQFGTSGAGYSILHAVDDQSLSIFGGSSSGAARLALYGASTASVAADYVLYSGVNVAYYFDSSANLHSFYSTAGTERVRIDSTSVSPAANDIAALGTTSLMWSDMFLASGGVINWNNGDVTITHSADTLTVAGGSLIVGTTAGDGVLNVSAGTANGVNARVGTTSNSGYTSDVFQVTALNHASGSGFWFQRNYASGPSVISGFRGDGYVYANTLDIYGGQIQFPAIQNASSNANTLDDYEEGTWTPTDNSGASLSFTSPAGRYIKVGKLVYASASLTYPVTASGSNSSIGSFPFTVANSQAARSGTVTYCASPGTAAFFILDPNATTGGFAQSSGASATNANMSGLLVYFHAVYEATA